MPKKKEVEKKVVEASEAEESHETPITPSETKEIRVIERVIENHAIAPADAFGKLTRPQIELIKRTVAKGASDDELRLFIQVCKGSRLNPFMKQAHLVPFWDSHDGVERRAIIVGIDGFRSVAEQSGRYAGNDDAVIGEDKEVEIKMTEWEGKTKKEVLRKMTVPSSATVTVYKVIEGVRCPFTATARWDEYYPGPKKGNRWHTMPKLMLSKCAEALALRKAFPTLLSGMYAQEEMDQASKGGEKVQESKQNAQTLEELIQNSSLEQLEEYKGKIATSTKYTEAQKEKIAKAIDERIADLKLVQQ